MPRDNVLTTMMRVSGTSFPLGTSGDFPLTLSMSPLAAPLFATVRANVVQSIRAFRPAELRDEAARLEQHFLYAHCAGATTKQEVLAAVAQAFCLTKSHARNVKGLADCLTGQLHKAGPQRGFVVVIDQLPSTEKFDRDARETLLDVFRDAADYWAERRVPFRVFYSFS
jgi:RNAse (barnase) inhibitor barstar